MRVFVYISYKGTNYHGWQMQNNAISLQQVITESLQLLLRDINLSIVASGRTDAGVHAKQQVFHMNIPDDAGIENLTIRLNGILPNDIVIDKIMQVDKKAHARFDATLRSYEYHLRSKKIPFGKDEYYHYSRPLNFELMNQAAGFLLGKHDFQSFSKVKTEVDNFICEVSKAEWVVKDSHAIFYISANRFLRSMVRTVVGTLLDVGECKIVPEDVKNIIALKDRSAAGRSVPAKGLYLCKVEYPQIDK